MSLFEPMRVGGLQLPNRIVMAPLGRVDDVVSVWGADRVGVRRRPK
jgi:hypothetical protein